MNKNIAGQLTYKSKKLHWLNRKTRPRMDYEWIEKTILKKSDKKNKKKTENQCQNAALKQKTTSEKWKFNSNKTLGLEWTTNGLGKPFRKKIRSKKSEKNSKNWGEIAAWEQKTTTEKATFCSNTVFSLYFKIRAKKLTPQNHSLFRSNSCFGVLKITTPIWLQKSWKYLNRS